MREQLVDQGSQLDALLSSDFVYISQDGRQLNKEEFQLERAQTSPIKNLEITSVSQKTKLIRYQIGDVIHTSAATKSGRISSTKKHEKTTSFLLVVFICFHLVCRNILSKPLLSDFLEFSLLV